MVFSFLDWAAGSDFLLGQFCKPRLLFFFLNDAGVTESKFQVASSVFLFPSQVAHTSLTSAAKLQKLFRKGHVALLRLLA